MWSGNERRAAEWVLNTHGGRELAPEARRVVVDSVRDERVCQLASNQYVCGAQVDRIAVHGGLGKQLMERFKCLRYELCSLAKAYVTRTWVQGMPLDKLITVDSVKDTVIAFTSRKTQVLLNKHLVLIDAP